MKLTYDTLKRKRILEERGLDFLDAEEIFKGDHFTKADERFDYPERRYITVGFLNNRMVVLVWTKRKRARRIISMRKANDRERKKFKRHLGRS